MSNQPTYRPLHTYSEPAWHYTAGIAILLCIALLVFRILLVFSYNGETGGIDNNFVYTTARYMAHQGLYSHPAGLPYSITLYPPLYFWVCSAIGRLFHVNTDDPIQVYRLCRSISLLADITTCLLLYRILRRRFTITPRLAWLAVAGFACILCLLGYTFSRSDSLLLCGYAAVLYLLMKQAPTKKMPVAIALALLSVVCILAKQNGIIIPILVMTWLLLHKETQMAVSYLTAFILAFTAVLLFCHARYPFLFDNTITALQNRIDLSWFYTDIFKRMLNSLWILPLYIAAGLSCYQWIKPVSTTGKALGAIFIIQAVFSLGTSLKWGSTAGYFNECFLLAFIIMARHAGRYATTVDYPHLKQGVAWLLPLLLLFSLHTLAQGYLFFIQNQPGKKKAYLQQKEVRDYLRSKLDEQYVLNLADPNADFFKLLFYKNIAVPNMDIVDCCTLPDRNFDYTGLKQDLARGKIGYIICREGDAPQTIWGVSLQDFKKETTMNGYTIYRYNP